MRPVYHEIGLSLQQNACGSVFPNGVPDPTIQRNTSRLTNSNEFFFMVIGIDEEAHVFGLDPIECTFTGTLATYSFVLLFKKDCVGHGIKKRLTDEEGPICD